MAATTSGWILISASCT